MESAVANLCSPGDRVVVVSAGAFGERWRNLATATVRRPGGGVRVGRDTAPGGSEGELDEVGGAKAVFLTHSETSTGVVGESRRWPRGEAVRGARRRRRRLQPRRRPARDGRLGARRRRLRLAEGADDTAGDRARLGVGGALCARGSSPRFYFDWERTRTGQAKLDSAFTPAVSLVRGLDVALGLLLDEGLEAAFDRHIRLGRACREGAKAMGLELFSPDEDRVRGRHAVLTPEGIDAGELRLALRDRYGVTVAGGHGDLKNRLFRIGHIGYYDVFDIVAALAAVELALVEAGAEVERGVGVARALEAFAPVPAGRGNA